MYGLSNRDFLTKRQTRWVFDIENSNSKSSNSNLSNSSNSNLSNSNSSNSNSNLSNSPINNIINCSKSNYNSKNSLKTKSASCFDNSNNLNDNTSKNNINYSKFDNIGNIEEKVINIEEKVINIEEKVINIEEKVINIEEKVIEISEFCHVLFEKLSQSILNLEKLISNSNNNNMTNSLNNSNNNNMTNSLKNIPNAKNDLEDNTNKDNSYEFTPFFIQEDYTGRDNLTLLKGENMNMLVEILGYYNDEPIIYPFGFERNFIKFQEMPIVLFIDNNDVKIYGIFKLDHDGIYKIYLNEIYDNNKLITLNTLSFPLKLQCNVNLIL